MRYRKGDNASLSPHFVTCSKCKIVKVSDDFYGRKETGDLRSQCKQCFADYRIKHATRHKQYRKEWYRRNESRVRETALKKYGLTLAEYDRLLVAQDGKCAICGNAETTKLHSKIRVLAVDHCHNTGKIRGLLCGSCNKGLGSFRDDPKLLQKARGYLEK